MGLGSAYKRWRHTRGYGVHSPYAYTMLTDVVRLKGGYEYYGYNAIGKAIRRLGKDINGFAAATIWHDACLLLRLAVYTHAERALIPDLRETDVLRTALRAANSRMHFCKKTDDAVLIYSRGEAAPLQTLLECISRPGGVIYLTDVPEGWRERIFAEMPEGIMFYGKHTLIASHRPETAKLAYSIRL